MPDGCAMTTANGKTRRELAHYFESSSHEIEVLLDGLVEVPFGEYLVELGAIDRGQLFEALMLQDLNPRLRVGECLAALGYLSRREIETLHHQYAHVGVVEVA